MSETFQRPEPTESPAARRWWLLAKVADYLMQAAIAATFIASVYVVSNLVGGDFIRFPLAPNGHPLSLQDQDRLVGNAELAVNVILLCSILVTLIAVVRWGWAVLPTCLAGIWGLLVFFGGPWVLAVSLARAANPANNITHQLGLAFEVTGAVVLGMVLARLVTGLVRRVLIGRPTARVPVELTREEEESVRKGPRFRSPMRRCWELSLCTDALRDSCPAYQNRKSCWRKGEGCLCDPLFWNRAMEAADRDRGARLSPTQRETRERIRRQLQIDTSGAARRARCRVCPIYDEHQHYKYRIVVWLAYPVTALIVWGLMPFIHEGFVWFSGLLNRMVSGAAFLPDKQPETQPFMSFIIETRGIEFLVMLAVAFIVVSYLLELTEYLVFDVKI